MFGDTPMQTSQPPLKNAASLGNTTAPKIAAKPMAKGVGRRHSGLTRLPTQLSRFHQPLIERALHPHRVCAIHVGDGNLGFGLQIDAAV
jgi:hypothetical protein